jgi:predicted esterase
LCSTKRDINSNLLNNLQKYEKSWNYYYLCAKFLMNYTNKTIFKSFMKRIVLLSMLFLPMAALAQKQYFLPTGDASADEKEKPMIEVYLPPKENANGCAVVLCPGGAMRWLSWDSDVVRMASFLNEHGIAAIGLRYHLNKGTMPQGRKMPPMVDVTHSEQFPKADANPMHDAVGDSIIHLAAMDANAAIRMVREHADEWNLSKDKIGYLGFSAGGGVAIAATMSADNIERPNFICTCFGPSLMPVTVPEDAPPLLIMTRADHPNVAAGLVALFMEWKKAGANAEMHIYGDGKGPYELMPLTGETTTELWSSQMIQWLKAKEFIK